MMTVMLSEPRPVSGLMGSLHAFRRSRPILSRATVCFMRLQMKSTTSWFVMMSHTPSVATTRKSI